ncbi:MAG: phage portal protein, partial [Planctomycetota bacterium]
MFKKIRRFFGGKKSSPASVIVINSGVGGAAWTVPDYRNMSREGYENCVVAYKCINKVAQGVASVPWVLKERLSDGTEKPVYQHDIVNLMRRANEWKSGAEMIYELMCHLQISGNAYIAGDGPISGPNRDKIKFLYNKRPDRMKVIIGQDEPQGYEYTVDGVPYKFPVDPRTKRCQVHHWKLFSPLDDWYGMSPITAASRDIDIHNAYGAWNYKLVDNDARPSAVATQTFDSDSKSEEKLKRDLNTEYGGQENPGKILVLPYGLQWHQYGLSPKDMEWIEGRYVSARDISNAFGVPAMMMGIPGDNKYANMVEAKLDFWESAITFYLHILTEGLNHWLVPRWETEGLDLFLEPDLSNTPIAQAQKDLKWKRAVEGGEFMLLNERREMVGLDPIPEGDVILVSMSMIPLDMALEGDDIIDTDKGSVSKAAVIAELRKEGYDFKRIREITQ